MRKLIDSSKIKLVLVVLAVVLMFFLGFMFLKNRTRNQGVSPSPEDTEAVAEVIDNAEDSDEPQEPSHAEILDEESEEADEGEQIFLMPKEEISDFSMTDANGILLEFERHGQDWVYIDDETLDINEDRIDKVLNYLADVHFVDSFKVEDGKEYGLSQKSKLYILTDASGYKTIISIGDTNDNGETYFAVNYDFNTVYVNSGKLSKVGDYYIEELIAF